MRARRRRVVVVLIEKGNSANCMRCTVHEHLHNLLAILPCTCARCGVCVCVVCLGRTLFKLHRHRHTRARVLSLRLTGALQHCCPLDVECPRERFTAALRRRGVSTHRFVSAARIVDCAHGDDDNDDEPSSLSALCCAPCECMCVCVCLCGLLHSRRSARCSSISSGTVFVRRRRKAAVTRPSHRRRCRCLRRRIKRVTICTTRSHSRIV